jgi:hypothetical protein
MCEFCNNRPKGGDLRHTHCTAFSKVLLELTGFVPA